MQDSMIPFQRWMEKVDSALVRKCGMDSGCLPDYCYWDAWKYHTPIAEVVMDVIRNAREY